MINPYSFALHPFSLGFLYHPGMIIGMIVPMILWEMVWKGIGLWHAARLSRKGWFVMILFSNFFGLIPIIFLLFVARKEEKKKGT